MDPNKHEHKQTPNKGHKTSENYCVEKKKGQTYLEIKFLEQILVLKLC
jgi:hypothetical protein